MYSKVDPWNRQDAYHMHAASDDSTRFIEYINKSRTNEMAAKDLNQSLTRYRKKKDY